MEKKFACDNIVLDFNGTIIDDCAYTASIANEMLTMQGHKTITVEEYKTHFTFPVIKFYKHVGFKLPPEGNDNFDVLAQYFIDAYRRDFSKVKVFPDFESFIKEYKGKKTLICLSATKQTELLGQVKMAGVDKHFDHIVGVSDIYAAGKVDVAKNFFCKTHLDPKKTLFIGDTVHDAEVAKELGANIILVSRGHQSKEVLMKGTDCLILDSLEEVKEYIE